MTDINRNLFQVSEPTYTLEQNLPIDPKSSLLTLVKLFCYPTILYTDETHNSFENTKTFKTYNIVNLNRSHKTPELYLLSKDSDQNKHIGI